MSDGEERFAAQQSFDVLMGVDVRNVGDVVAFFFHPETEWMLPQEKLARTIGQRHQFRRQLVIKE